MSRILQIALLLCGALLTSLVSANDKSLYWKSLDVVAHLDADGRLQVRERHHMVFDGPWNGGERRFRLDNGQKLVFTSLSQVDVKTEAQQKLKRGDLESVGEFKWLDGNVLRWRSRLSSDPPFEHDERIYDIIYTLSGILLKDDHGYRLAHDFAFPDRPGEIEHFTLELSLDPAWTSNFDTHRRFEYDHIKPRYGMILKLQLQHTDSHIPSAIAEPTSVQPGRVEQQGSLPALTSVWRWFLIFSVVTFAIVHVYLLVRREILLGRFQPLVSPNKIDAAWLRENLFIYPPEVAGAAWSGRVGKDQFAAVLARMEGEGKLRSDLIADSGSPKNINVLQLTLLHNHFTLPEHEQVLVDALFDKSEKITTTARVAERYSKKGFDPVRKVAPNINRQLKKLIRPRQKLPVWRPQLTFALGAAVVAWITVALLIEGGAMSPSKAGFVSLLLFSITTVVLFAWAKITAHRYAREAKGFLRHLVLIAILYVCLLTLLGGLLLLPLFDVGTVAAIALTLAVMVAGNSIANGMYAREVAGTMELRRKLGAAIHFFEVELCSTQPRLQDAWLPYLLSFGLGLHLHRWHVANTVASDSPSETTGTYINDSTTSSPASSVWSGNGGAFGGGGASGSWVAAVGALATGVASPSSSNSRSSDSSSSSGGSSSGGGGGGGW